MGNVEQHLGYATSTTSLHYQLTDLWRSPRGTVLRIEALALVAIALSFFLAIFGSCRRWSNRWIVQKGFLAAQVLSLSLGTYSIGLMQSSSVKSEMYPIWAVSLLTLFGCVEPVTTYIGLDYKGLLLKVIFQLCLYCGYVLLMSVSTISGGVGKLAISVLSPITFIKGFHRSLALVLPSRTRNKIGTLVSAEPRALAGYGNGLEVHLPIRHSEIKRGIIWKWDSRTTMADIHRSCSHMQGEVRLGINANDKTIIEDVCLGYSLSHLLHRRFLGLDTAKEMEEKRMEFESLPRDGGPDIDYKRTLKAVDIELAFLFEVFFTSNEFIHYYEAKASSFWALASFIGIIFVGVAIAIPGTMAGCCHRITSTGSGAGTVIVEITTADLVVTLVIFVSLALLQLLQLIRCWTSNWARVAFACEYAKVESESEHDELVKPRWWWAWMRLKAFVVTRINWFDKYLWQDNLGQYSIIDFCRQKNSVIDAASSRREKCCRKCWKCLQRIIQSSKIVFLIILHFYGICDRLARMLGLQYIGQVLLELVWVTEGGADVMLHGDVKTSFADFLRRQIKSRRLGKDWSTLFVDNGIDASCLPFSNAPLLLRDDVMSHAYAFTHRVMVWHIATWYCKQAEQAGTAGGGERGKNRRVAIALSDYCTYLVVSAPELLPGPSAETKRAFDRAAHRTNVGMGWTHGLLPKKREHDAFVTGVYWGKRLRDEMPPPPGCTRQLCSDTWEVLARLWVQTLLYAAPYGDMQAHMQHLSQGGEFITHLWALLYHIGIDKWEHEVDAQGTN
ncbi:unnamed protein product [Urochloa humidicola]